MTFWSKNGKELFYLAADRSVMSVDVGTGATPFGKPRVLFRPAADILAGIAPGTPASAATARSSCSRCRVPNCAS